jgi:acetyl-CoA carboxylase biotin carboxyl carrier protein
VTADDDPLLLSAGVSADQLYQVLDLVAGTDISELDLTIGATRLTLRRPPVLATPLNPAVPEALTNGAPAASGEPPRLAITSPLVGLFRAAVAPGDVVQAGQAIGRVEALGMPTNVDAPQGGTVDELLVHDGSPVEYGQPLLTLRRAPYAT